MYTIVNEEAVLAGDERAFEEMVREESSRLYHVILRIVKDEDEAQSLVQETFLQAYKSMDRFRGESKLSTWLIGIGINLARSSLRKTSRYDTLAEEDMERLQPSFNMGAYTEEYSPWRPDVVADKSQRREIVHRAIEQLSDTYREIIILRDIEQLDTSETAQALDITEGAARVRLHRARQALRTLLDDHFGDPS
ncbi:MAG: sigma-70 family RNA polymerase sigma factor [Bacteroidetes bacterium]|jgi:RNA polymerase sigma-70 factor (ECF subfamily)|nr:sigma-70 family RNA polymerase sigma factor [Bacteroidota bacterium]